MSTVAFGSFDDWLGTSQTSSEQITLGPAANLSATLDYPNSLVGVGDSLPPAWHWLYFQSPAAASGLGDDGHTLRGEFLPPVPLPRRMWATSKMRFVTPVLVGQTLRRVSTIEHVKHKHGASGDLIFVTVRHRLLAGEQLAIEEQQTIVYCAANSPSPKVPSHKTTSHDEIESALRKPEWSRQVRPDSVMLFRYSALTFNSHRIHYDRNYAVDVEGYPDLVVQGPLTATLLLDLLCRNLPDAQVSTFQFRGVSPAVVNQVLELQGRREGGAVELWALNASGDLLMEASAELHPN